MTQSNAEVSMVQARKAKEQAIQAEKAAGEAGALARAKVVSAFRNGNEPQVIARGTGWGVEQVRAIIFAHVDDN